MIILIFLDSVFFFIGYQTLCLYKRNKNETLFAGFSDQHIQRK